MNRRPSQRTGPGLTPASGGHDVTGDGRLPAFLIVGAMRSGTTSLARYLASHPDVLFAPQKEVHFFDRNFHRGVAWYASQFAGDPTLRLAGEATPSYMYDELAVERMSHTVPHAKLIAVLRDPTERA